MDGASLTLAATSMCIKLFIESRTRYLAFHHAETEIRELVLVIGHETIKVESQMEVLSSLWESMNPQLQISQNLLLETLQLKLQRAVTLVDGLIGEPDERASWKSLWAKYGEVRRAKYAAWSKSQLEKIVEEIDSWERRFDPTWWLTIKANDALLEKNFTASAKRPGDLTRVKDIIAGLTMGQGTNVGEQAASRSIFMDGEELHSSMNMIQHSGVRHSSLAYGGAEMIVDARTTFAEPNPDVIDEVVRRLAHRLQNVNPMTFGLLRCYGVVRSPDDTGRLLAFHFIFEVPRGLTDPRSLRMLLLESDWQYPLEERVRLGRLMARSVAFVHNVGLVHKNVSPKTILLFKDGKSNLGMPFLVGFEKFRSAGGASIRSGDAVWETNLYRHPDRQGLEPERDYIMQHDIYSLGVCLLEIGLWESSISWDRNTATADLSTELKRQQTTPIRGTQRERESTKAIFVDMAKRLLPSRARTKYKDVVVTCLRCLDDGNAFGDESDFLDSDGIGVGVRFIEKVLMQLEDIAL